MAKTVKQALVEKSKGTDWPPTPEDKKMTVDHTSHSIVYNTPHAVDHLDETISKAERLKQHDPKKAKKLIADVLKEIKPLIKKLESI